MVGASLELPYDVLLKEFNSSYSAAKGALEEAREAIMMRRTWLIDDLCQPVYEMWLAEAVATGRVKAPGFFTDPLIRAAWSAARWDGPAQIHLDPVKEANANEIQVRNGWKTNAQITRESYGGDWDDNADIVLREAEKFAAKMISYFSNQKGDNGNAGNTD
jgi:capsid protein